MKIEGILPPPKPIMQNIFENVEKGLYLKQFLLRNNRDPLAEDSTQNIFEIYEAKFIAINLWKP